MEPRRLDAVDAVDAAARSRRWRLRDTASPRRRRHDITNEHTCAPQVDNVKRTVEVNLTDRSSFNYPLLIGAKALREFGAAVNPARRYTADKPDC